MITRPDSNTSLRARIYAFYKAGLDARTIHAKTGWNYEYVDKLCFEWALMEVQEKKKEEAAFELPPPSKRINNTSETDFALITNNPDVRAAYERLINPHKEKLTA